MSHKNVCKQAAGAATEAVYQPRYIPPPRLTRKQRKELADLRNVALCNAEVARVTINIVNAMRNEETPDDVRAVIKAYLGDLFHYDWTEDPEAIGFLFPLVCRRISRPPFVPMKPHIEALTCNNLRRAKAAVKDPHDYKPHSSVSAAFIAGLTDRLFRMEQEETEKIAATIIALANAIGFEPHPRHRKYLTREVCHRAYCQTVEYSDAEDEFIDSAVAAAAAESEVANEGE